MLTEQRSWSTKGALAGAAVAGAAVVGSAAWLLAEFVVDRMTRPNPAPPPGSRDFSPFETGVAWEDVVITAEDGAPMRGWLMTRNHAASAIVACGGYRGRRTDLLGISSSLWRAGFNVLLFDYRGYGDVPDRVTLGYRELADARAALQFIRRHSPEAPLGVIGFSMGAAIAIMLAAREPDVRCTVADSPFASQQEIVRLRLARAFGLRPSRWTAPLAHAILWLADHGLHRRFGFRFADVHPLRDVARLAGRPLLLIHGEDDEIVPVEHSRRVAAAAHAAGVDLETWYVPNAGHCAAYFLDRPAYCARVAAFFQRHLSAAAPLVDSDPHARVRATG